METHISLHITINSRKSCCVLLLTVDGIVSLTKGFIPKFLIIGLQDNLFIDPIPSGIFNNFLKNIHQLTGSLP